MTNKSSRPWKNKTTAKPLSTPSSSNFDMTETLVSDCFVPEKDRRWNEVAANITLQPMRALPTSERQAEFLRHTLCPSIPLVSHEVVLAEEHEQQQQQQQSADNTIRIPFRSFPSDLHFATRARTNPQILAQYSNSILPCLETLCTTTSNDTSPTKRNQQQQHLLYQYATALESLLNAERRQVLTLYERYSQYKTRRISFLEPPTKGSSPSVIVEIEGIADAAPSINVGDILLLRPCALAEKKIPYNPYYTMPPKEDANMRDMMEVQCQVLSVSRGRATGGGKDGAKEERYWYDRVQATWLEPRQFQELGYTHTIPQAFYKAGSSPVNIRIVPTPIPMIRQLTAADWLRSTIPSATSGRSDSPTNKNTADDDEEPQQQQQPHALQELLFPTQAVSLPPMSDAELFGTTAAGAAASPTSARTIHTLQQLNVQQLSFVRDMMQRTKHFSTDQIRGPAILSGPAGTGKTRTMLAAIERILTLNTQATGPNRLRILICTPSHTAANVITQRLGAIMAPQQLFRLLDASRPTNTIPVTLSPFCRLDDNTGSFMLPSLAELFTFDVIVSTCLDCHLLYRAGFTNQQLRTQRLNIVQSACGQLQACGVQASQEMFPSNIMNPHLTHLFIDEAAQATEAESLVALSVVADPVGAGVRKVEVALVGDPRQLSPRVFCSKAAEAGLGRSWMERLLRQRSDCTGGGSQTLLGPDMNLMESLLRFSLQSQNSLSLSHFLTVNYRGHPAFLALPSALFYSDLLQCAPPEVADATTVSSIRGGVAKLQPREWLEKLRIVESLSTPVVPQLDDGGGDEVVLDEVLVPRKHYEFPIHFRGVIGKDVSVTVKSGFAADSWQNREEANAVVEIIKSLLSKDGGVTVDPRSIGVMAPFRGQVDLIRKLLRQQGFSSVDVGTIEDYQAKECDVVILSLTRSLESLVKHDINRRLGVYGQPKRSNVAMTRAESLFVVVGNPNTMMKHFIWRQFLMFCFRNGLYYGEKNDTSYPLKGAVATKNLLDLAASAKRRSELEDESEHKHEPTPPSQTNFDGVIVSSLERLLRSSNTL